MATPIPPTEADAHIAELVALAEAYEEAAITLPQNGRLHGNFLRRAAAIRWILAETAHGVDETEIVT